VDLLVYGIIEIQKITTRSSLSQDESTMTYLQRSKEEMFNVERLVKPISKEALINGLYNFD
jgi:hypothetical protein